MPIDFVDKPKLVFMRLEAATEIPSLFEVKIRTRFIVLIMGPVESQAKLYEIGRAISTCLADDVTKIRYLLSRIVRELTTWLRFAASSSIQPRRKRTFVRLSTHSIARLWSFRRVSGTPRFVSSHPRNTFPRSININWIDFFDYSWVNLYVFDRRSEPKYRSCSITFTRTNMPMATMITPTRL